MNLPDRFFQRIKPQRVKNPKLLKINLNLAKSLGLKVEDLNNISNYVKSVEEVQNIKIACLEEISLIKKWINRKDIGENIKFNGNCDYSNYLKKLFSY